MEYYDYDYQEERQNSERRFNEWLNDVEIYYQFKTEITREDIDKIIELSKRVKKYNKHEIYIKTGVYPMILFLFNDDELVYITAVENQLESRLVLYNSSAAYKPYTHYGYITVEPKYLYPLFAELLIYYNPRSIDIRQFKQRECIYRSFNTAKRRFRYIDGIDLRILKKVCSLYDVPVYNLRNGITIVNRDELDMAICRYFGKPIEEMKLMTVI